MIKLKRGDNMFKTAINNKVILSKDKYFLEKKYKIKKENIEEKYD